MISKHAFLIIAHNEPYAFEKLIGLLDADNNDIFVHIDKRSDITQFNKVKTIHSKLIFTERIATYWGGYEQIATELILLKTAHNYGPYEWYHLLSSVDMPIKSNQEIHSFFDSHQNSEFIGFAQDSVVNRSDIENKMAYRHILIKYWKSNNMIKKAGARIIHNAYIILQKFVHYRWRSDWEIKKGANWFSITNEFCEYVLLNKQRIEKTFKHGFCID